MAPLQLSRAASPNPRGASLLAATALMLALLLAWQSASLFRRDLAFTAAETEVSFWGREDYLPAPPTRARTEAALNALLVQAPVQPDYLTLAANLYAWQAYWAEAPAVEQNYALRAVSAQYVAQQSRPAYRQGWQKMIGYATNAEGVEPRRILAEQALAALGTSAEPASAR